MDAMISRPIVLILLTFGWVIPQAQQMNWVRLAEDTIYYAREYQPDRLMVTASGPAQILDFRSLRSSYAISRRILISGDREGKTYANLVHGKQSVAILQLSGKSALIHQVMDDNPVCKGSRLTYTLTPAYKPFFNGVLGEYYTYRGRMSSAFAWPRGLTCTWSPAQIPDSCRITYTILEEIVVDGEGILYLPTEVSSAYRHKVEIRKALKVEVKYGNKWNEMTSQIPGVRLITTTELFRFVSSNSGLLLAEIELSDDLQPMNVEFKTHPLVTRVFPEEPTRPDIFAYPNPSYDVVRFQLCDLLFGRYKLKIFNILGVPVREMDFDVDDERKTITLDLSELQRGTYLYRLQDSTGRTIRTKRIVLIQP